MALFPKGKKQKIFRVLISSAMLLTCVIAPGAVYSEISLFAPHKGMCYITWDKNRFASQYSDESLKKLSSMGVEYISVCLTH